jgi:Helix-turn-helix domain
MSLNKGFMQVHKCKAILERNESLMESNILTVSHNKEINLANGETKLNVYVRVYTSLFTSGLVAKMGSNRFTTLMALASYMDEKGECYPTQIQLADAIGVHKNTINKYINELLEFEIEGKPLVTRKKVNRGQGKISSYYKIHPLSQLAKFGGEIESINTYIGDKGITDGNDKLITKGSDSLITTNCDVITITNNNQLIINNSSDAIKYFQKIYQEVYGVNYTVSNYGREGKLMKDKVLADHKEMAKEIIETGIKRYSEFSNNPNFPRPSIGMFGWAVNKIIPLIEEELKVSEIASQSVNLEEQAELEMLAKLEKLGGGQ